MNYISHRGANLYKTVFSLMIDETNLDFDSAVRMIIYNIIYNGSPSHNLYVLR